MLNESIVDSNRISNIGEYDSLASDLVDFFDGVVSPDIFLTHSNEVSVQQIVSVKVRF